MSQTLIIKIMGKLKKTAKYLTSSAEGNLLDILHN